MSGCDSCGSPPKALVLRGVDVAQLLRVLRPAAPAATPPATAAAPSPPRGANEPGKGLLVDRLA